MVITAKIELGDFYPTKNKIAGPLLRYLENLRKQSDKRFAKKGDSFPFDIPMQRKRVELDILDQLNEPVIKPLYRGHDVVSIDGIIFPRTILFVTGYGGAKPIKRAVIQENVWREMKRCVEFKCTPKLLYWFGKPADDGYRYYEEVELEEIKDIKLQIHHQSTSNKIWFTLPNRRFTYTSSQQF